MQSHLWVSYLRHTRGIQPSHRLWRFALAKKTAVSDGVKSYVAKKILPSGQENNSWLGQRLHLFHVEVFGVSAQHAECNRAYPYPVHPEAFEVGGIVVGAAGKGFVKLT